MATVRKAVTIARPADEVWDAVSDAGALHTRVAPHVVTHCALTAEGEERIVTFVNGIVLRELIISNDPLAKRLAWSALSDQWQHHNASVVVTPLDEQSCEVVWTADVLPHSAGALMEQFLTMGLDSMKLHMDPG